MTKPVRKPVWLLPEHWELLQKIVDKQDRTPSWIIRNVFDKITAMAESTGIDPVCVLGAPGVHLACTLGVPEVNHAGTRGEPGVTTPSPARGRGSFSGSKKEEEEEEKKKETRLAPLDVTKRILDDLNERAETNFQARGKKARTLIAVRLRAGFTEDDFFEVHRKKCKEWLGTDMERHLTYETLYGTKFEKYVGQKDVGPQTGFAMTEGEKRAERYTGRKKTKYPTNRTRGQT